MLNGNSHPAPNGRAFPGTVRIDVPHLQDSARAAQRATQGAEGLAGGLDRVELSAGLAAGGLHRAVLEMAAVALAVRTARGMAGFEASLARIGGLVGVAEAEVKAMGDALTAWAPAVGQGPGALAEALFVVTSAGARGAEALDIVEQSARRRRGARWPRCSARSRPRRTRPRRPRPRTCHRRLTWRQIELFLARGRTQAGGRTRSDPDQ